MYDGTSEKLATILLHSNEVFQFHFSLLKYMRIAYAMGTSWQTFGIKRFLLFLVVIRRGTFSFNNITKSVRSISCNVI